MNEEKYEYKASDLNINDNKSRIKATCNEYGLNLGSSRRKQEDLFDQAIRLKHFNNLTK